MIRTFAVGIFALLFVTAPAVASSAATDTSDSDVAKQADDNPVKTEWLACTGVKECVLVAQDSQCSKVLAVNKKHMDQFPSVKTCIHSPSYSGFEMAACTSQGKCVVGLSHPPM